MSPMTPDEARAELEWLAKWGSGNRSCQVLQRALETIAAMRTEHCVQHQMSPGGLWHQVTRWNADPNPYNEGHGPSDDERIATRYVLDPEADQSS